MNIKTVERVQFREMSDDMYLFSEIVSQNGWTDVESFCQGEMITKPIEVNGWKLIPADQYKYSIPAEAVERVIQLINAGVQIQGIVIADDLRSYETKQKPPKPRSPKVTPEPRQNILEPNQINWDGVVTVLKVLGAIVAVFVAVIAAIITMSVLIDALVKIGAAIIVVVGILGALAFDPKLIVVISDGDGGMEWVCLYTWYD